MKKNLLTIFLIFLISQSFAFCSAQEQDKRQYLNLSFWQKFNDEILINNIIKGYENNPDLKIADTKIKESEKIVKLSLAEELPHINFEGMLGRTFASSDMLRGKNNFMIYNYSQTRFLLPLTASYEIDIWGKNRLRTKSFKESEKMLKEDERAVYIALSSAIAADYYNLIKTDKIIELQNELLNLNEKLLKLTISKEQNGLATKDDILEIQEKTAQITLTINDLEAKKEIFENQLSYLLGDKLFSKIERNDFKNVSLIDNVPSELNSSIIINRPDVKSSAYNILRADYEAKSAKRDILPSFTIMGTLGFNGYSHGTHLFSPNSGLADLWIVPNFDIFDGGRKYNLMKLKKLEYERAKQEYEKSVLASIQEVNDALVMTKKEKKNYKIAADVFDIQSQKLRLKSINKNLGLANELDYILYQQAQILAQQKLVDDKINYVISTINLYKSVGGVDFTNSENL